MLALLDIHMFIDFKIKCAKLCTKIIINEKKNLTYIITFEL